MKKIILATVFLVSFATAAWAKGEFSRLSFSVKPSFTIKPFVRTSELTQPSFAINNSSNDEFTRPSFTISGSSGEFSQPSFSVAEPQSEFSRPSFTINSGSGEFFRSSSTLSTKGEFSRPSFSLFPEVHR